VSIHSNCSQKLRTLTKRQAGGPCHPKLRLQGLVGFETRSTHARRSGAQKGLEYPQWRAKRIIADHGLKATMALLFRMVPRVFVRGIACAMCETQVVKCKPPGRGRSRSRRDAPQEREIVARKTDRYTPCFGRTCNTMRICRHTRVTHQSRTTSPLAFGAKRNCRGTNTRRDRE